MATFGFTGCGGGGGGASFPVIAPVAGTTTQPTQPIVASASVANACAAPRAGVNPATGGFYADRPGSAADEKLWIRGWIDETYLWFDEVPKTLLATDYSTPGSYFNVLKTPLLTASGKPKDRFHYTIDTSAYRAQQQSAEPNYGLEFAFLSRTVPRDVRVAYTEPGSAAAGQGIARGAQVLSIDGVDAVSGIDTSTLNAGLLPKTAGESHSFTFKFLDGSTQSITLATSNAARTPVQNVRSIDTASGRVGYLQFNDIVAPAEAQLVAAVNQFKSDGITDLVLDLRYNGGGLLDLASELATMIAPPAATAATTFERLRFNSKSASNTAVIPFHAVSRGLSVPAGQPLPQLGLSHITVLAGPDTCSAAESVVNSLRGVGVKVDLVGGTTCGKPYGFYPKDNCGTTYFAIQFQGVNNVGFGDYGDGFAPTCAVADDFDHALGDPAEARLAAALGLRSSGACPAVAASKLAGTLQKSEAAREPYLERSPQRENRWIAPGVGVE